MMTSVADVEGVAAAGATGIFYFRIPDPDPDYGIIIKANF